MIAENRKTTMRPEDVPSELVETARRRIVGAEDVALREMLAAVLPAARRMWFRELFGDPGDPEERRNEPRQPDDPIDLCERIRPGLHEQQVRAKAATEIKANADLFDPIAEPPTSKLLLSVIVDELAARIAHGERP